MRNNICLYLLFFIFSLFFIRLKITFVVGADNYKCIKREREALLQFKASVDTAAEDLFPTWTHDENATNDYCDWYGVTCNNQTGHVISLVLRRGYLNGEISPSLLNLSCLYILDLSDNWFEGNIPTFFGSMTQLRFLNLSHNGFFENNPNIISSMPHLRSLDLAFNSLYGTIPMSNSSMSQLRYLDLSHNDFNGTIPISISSMTQLRHLDLHISGFDGNIPKFIGSLTELRYLDLSINQFIGTLPLNDYAIENLDWLSHLSQLEYLSMDGVSLAKVDKWVNLILNLHKLVYLSFVGCDLSQVMHPYSHSIVDSSFSPSIVWLYLDDNNLNSSIYQWLFLLISNRLETLSLSANKLDQIPMFLGNQCDLRMLSLTNNSIAITFSDLLNNLCGVSLQSLLVAQNQLTGSLSDDIQKFESLEHLDLSYNKLSGTISEKIWQLTKLQELKLSFNSLNGTISKNVRKSSISKADMSNLSNIQRIELSSNNFYGHLPIVSSTVTWIDFSKNKFFGRISFLCQIVNGSLSFLDLSSNSLSGQIPECLWHFRELNILNLGQNNFVGRLPASIKYLTNLNLLNLFNNSLSGELPSSLQNCTLLRFLDLGANSFSGYIPLWIGYKLDSLHVLGLTSNNFFGTIPTELCYSKNLQIMDLSKNKLHGTIPSCLNNITTLVQGEINDESGYVVSGNVVYTQYVEYAIIKWQGRAHEFGSTLRFLKSIDLSHNNLTGNIPNEIITLSELFALDLSMNALHGDIPPKIGLMKHLLSLDLSGNNLSGNIPTSMSQMTSLDYLDVSYNNLSGKIPLSTQLQSFEPSSYTGNAGLCGLPLIKNCPGDEEPEVLPIIGENKDDGEDKDDLERWFSFGATIGFAIGFWTICSGLLLNRRGRHVFFHFMNSLDDCAYVKVLVLIRKCGRASSDT